jgi:putative ABC transport system permease protein
MWRWTSLETLWQDLRYALRMMRRSPGFTAVAVLSLSLGIGANTAIFSLINILMLRLLPVKNPQQLVELLSRYPGEPRINGFSWQSYEHYRDHNHVFSGLIGTSGPTRLNVRSEGFEPETLTGEHVVGNFFPVLGMTPAIGRLIGPEDNSTETAPAAVAVVSWFYWKSRFNLEPAILGQQIFVENTRSRLSG